MGLILTAMEVMLRLPKIHRMHPDIGMGTTMVVIITDISETTISIGCGQA